MKKFNLIINFIVLSIVAAVFYMIGQTSCRLEQFDRDIENTFSIGATMTRLEFTDEGKEQVNQLFDVWLYGFFLGKYSESVPKPGSPMFANISHMLHWKESNGFSLLRTEPVVMPVVIQDGELKALPKDEQYKLYKTNLNHFIENYH